MVGSAVPLSSHAAPVPSVDGDRSSKWLVHVTTTGAGREQAVYYYTNVVLTGSHVPAVIRRYRGKMEIVAGASINGKAYSVGDLGTASVSDVGGSLAGLDPAISVGGSH